MTPNGYQPPLAKYYKEKVVPRLRDRLGYKNIHQIPRLEKIVINCSVGSHPDVKASLEEAVRDIANITGQRPIITKARKSISNFKLRKGQQIGAKVTLRGKVMYDFLDKLINIALPAIRDFRGVSPRAFDGRGNYTLGIKDHSIFPEIELDKVKRNIGFDITIVTTATTDAEGKALLEELGMPFSGKKTTTEKATAEKTTTEITNNPPQQTQ